jgi:hypothetical protein
MRALGAHIEAIMEKVEDKSFEQEAEARSRCESEIARNKFERDVHLALIDVLYES